MFASDDSVLRTVFMRVFGYSALIIASLALTGCRSSSGVEQVLSPVPSNEVTNSVTVASAAPTDIGSLILEAQNAYQGGPFIPESEKVLEAALMHPSANAALNAPLPKAKPEQVAMLKPSSTPATPLMRSRIYGQQFKDAKPINFGKISPRSHAVHGVDISRWQGDIDWEKLRSHGANFAFIKATDGGDHLDPMFKKNWRAAEEAGLKRGAYHFFYWCRTGAEQADWFIRNVPKVPGALPPVIDVEWNGESRCRKVPPRAQVIAKMQAFMDKLERHYGQRPIIYTAPDFYADNLKGEFLDYPFWLRAVAQHPSKVYPGRKWVFWQYSGSGLSKGVKGKIDLNVFHGSEDDWRRWVSAVGS